MKKIVLLTGIAFILLQSFCAPGKETEIEPEDRMQWWDSAKFGMFIHWGLYSVPAGICKEHEISGIGEWIMNLAKIPVAGYRGYAAEFNPVKYDPEAWVQLAKNAGMKYIVITSKHHDGFALFDSKVTNWDVVDATPYGKDLLAPLVEACRKEGIKIGFYYSQAQDWVHPGGAAGRKLAVDGWPNPDSAKIDLYTAMHNGHWDSAQEGDFDEYLDKIAVPQVKEILSNYGELDVLWWDTPKDMTPERAGKFLPVIEKYPKLITNNRLGGGVEGDTETPEQFIPPTGFPDRHWEVCMTMNDTWGYKSNDNDWKSTKDLILKLSEVASKGGNFLLNVGPTAEGEIPQASIERLNQIGEWMKVNHEAIYGTQASPFPFLPWGRATLKEGKLFLHIVTWPEDGYLRVPLKNRTLNARMLSHPDTKLQITQDSEGVVVKLPTEVTDSVLPIVVLEFEGNPRVHAVPSNEKLGKASSEEIEKPVTNLFDGNPKNAWMPHPDDKDPWVEVDLEEPVSIGAFSITEPWHPWNNESQKFLLQYKKNGEWADMIEGKTNGCGHTQTFKPVTGRYFRLKITGSKGKLPVLNEWALYRGL